LEQIGGERWQSTVFALRPPVANLDVLAFDEARFCQTASKGVDVCFPLLGRGPVQKADDGLCATRRSRIERREHKTAAGAIDERAPIHVGSHGQDDGTSAKAV